MSEIRRSWTEHSSTLGVERYDGGVRITITSPDDWARMTLSTEQADSLAKFLIDHGIAERARAQEASA